MAAKEDDQEVLNLMTRAQSIAATTMGKQQVAEAFVLAIYYELKNSKPATYPRITKLWVERNNYNGDGGVPNRDIYSRLMEIQLTEHCFKKVRIDAKTYELMGGTER